MDIEPARFEKYAQVKMGSFPQFQGENSKKLWNHHLANYRLGCPPSQDSSHHQDDTTIFRIGDPELNLHLPQLLGGGTTQAISVK